MADTPTLDDWLGARHNKWNTPTSLINEYVRKATGSAIAQASRVILGLDNEVYDVTTPVITGSSSEFRTKMNIVSRQNAGL